jgi:hypothetical protein
LFRRGTIEEAMIAFKASIPSPAAQPQDQALEDILARDTVDLLALTFRTHVLLGHDADPDVEAADAKDPGPMVSRSEIVTRRLPLRERAWQGQSANEVRCPRV